MVNLLLTLYVFIFVTTEISGNVISDTRLCNCIGFEVLQNIRSIIVPQNLVFHWFLLKSDKHKRFTENFKNSQDFAYHCGIQVHQKIKLGIHITEM